MLKRLSRPDGYMGAGMSTVEPLMGLVPCRFRVPPRTLWLDALINDASLADSEAACLNNDPALGRILNGAHANSRFNRIAYLAAGSLQCSRSHPGCVNSSPSRQRAAQPNRQGE